MIEDGHLARIDTGDAGIPTQKGVQVGDSENDVLPAYGDSVEVRKQAYTSGTIG